MFHVSLLEQNSTKNGRMNKLPEFKMDDNKKYKMEAICNSTIYGKEANKHLPKLYYLVA